MRQYSPTHSLALSQQRIKDHSFSTFNQAKATVNSPQT